MRFEEYEHPIEALKRQGRLQGQRQGRLQGRSEKQQEIARNMKSDGLPAEKIATYTGLSLKVVEKL
ncbi:hypothetical protein AGMMS50255_9130 [Spirochaetia bacterium]|nr:hypothetical protein AGMMS50255_9130 [Spirochaetia bacterium]